jgi:hypothetical protein
MAESNGHTELHDRPVGELLKQAAKLTSRR